MVNYKLKYSLAKNSILLVISSVMLFLSCAPLPITVEEFEDNVGIRKGEKAKIRWKIANADRVKVSGDPEVYEAYDSAYVSPDRTKQYTVTAYQGNTDSLVLYSDVIVDAGAGLDLRGDMAESSIENDEDIHVGPNILKQTKLTPSFIPSEYFRGLKRYDDSNGPTNLKIMKTIYPYGSNNNFLIRAVLLDQYGNFLFGNRNALVNTKWTAESNYDNVRIKHNPNKIIEMNDSLYNNNIDIGIIVDNSAVAESNNGIMDYVIQFISSLTTNDYVTFSYYNQDYHNTLPLLPADQAIWTLDNKVKDQPPVSGLNALNKAAYKTLKKLILGDNKDKALVIISYYADNSSIIYTANDAAKLAKQYNIPIYIIGIGDALKSYQVKYLSSVSGGRFYYLAKYETSAVSDILTEIALSHRFYYEFQVPPPSDVNGRDITYDFSYSEAGINVNEKLNMILKQYAQYSQYQALASFHEKDINVDEEYLGVIKSLAKVLVDNPKSKIQLVGHSGLEGNTGFNMDISRRRAMEIKNLLHEYGVRQDQVSVKAEGSSKPVFYFEQENWQGYYNRRVEVRWLDPSILPYEIIAEQTDTENDALSKISKWEELGYRAYFDRYLQNNDAIYRVKLWGYPTIEKAEEEAKQLEKKYRSKFVIE